MQARSKAILSLATIFLCLMIFFQSAFAYTYPKSARERRLGSKPSWISPIPVVSRVIWELKSERTVHLGGKNISYTYGFITLVIGVAVAIPTIAVGPTILGKRAEKKEKKEFEIKEKPTD